MAKKDRKTRIAEDRARSEAVQEFIDGVIRRTLEREGKTREDYRKLLDAFETHRRSA